MTKRSWRRLYLLLLGIFMVGCGVNVLVHPRPFRPPAPYSAACLSKQCSLFGLPNGCLVSAPSEKGWGILVKRCCYVALTEGQLSCSSSECPGAVAGCKGGICKSDLTTTANCGACGTVCSDNNVATVTCAGGKCTGACKPGFADCNGNKQLDGCETDITTSADCGGCDHACPVDQSCVAGECSTASDGVCTDPLPIIEVAYPGGAPAISNGDSVWLPSDAYVVIRVRLKNVGTGSSCQAGVYCSQSGGLDSNPCAAGPGTLFYGLHDVAPIPEDSEKFLANGWCTADLPTKADGSVIAASYTIKCSVNGGNEQVFTFSVYPL